MNGIEIVQEEAVKQGFTLSNKDAEYFLWEETGFPCWWHIGRDGDTPEECLRTQIGKFFKEHRITKPIESN